MDADAIEVYWVPGCSSCLLMKDWTEPFGVTPAAPLTEDDLAGLPLPSRIMV